VLLDRSGTSKSANGDGLLDPLVRNQRVTGAFLGGEFFWAFLSRRRRAVPERIAVQFVNGQFGPLFAILVVERFWLFGRIDGCNGALYTIGPPELATIEGSGIY
jgi:hypothetical protein